MKKILVFIMLFFFSTEALAELYVIRNENQNKKSVRYKLWYGPVKEDDPLNYPYTLDIIPHKPISGEYIFDLSIDQASDVPLYFVVKDYYEDETQTDFSHICGPYLITFTGTTGTSIAN